MVFGIANQTRKAFVSFGAFGINIAGGWFEEISFNITQVHPANAIDVVDVVPDISDSQILVKKCAYSAGSVLASLALKDKVISIISGATFTGLL